MQVSSHTENWRFKEGFTVTIDLVRDSYIEQYRQVLASMTAEGRQTCTELCIQVNSPRPPLYQLYVVDGFERLADGQTRFFDVNVEPIDVDLPQYNVDAPLAWNGIQFRCRSNSFCEDILVAWGHRWISDENPPFGPQDEFTGIIHRITQPEVCGQTVKFSIDFGSAPVVAFHELLAGIQDSLSSMGS